MIVMLVCVCDDHVSTIFNVLKQNENLYFTSTLIISLAILLLVPRCRSHCGRRTTSYPILSFPEASAKIFCSREIPIRAMTETRVFDCLSIGSLSILLSGIHS
ncbi:unnamed protein product [Amoebophrya sp. A25]|nr:unnamed protein product [Amoebophrya sp. A25]|eukprot:GSA25T00013642001.1